MTSIDEVDFNFASFFPAELSLKIFGLLKGEWIGSSRCVHSTWREFIDLWELGNSSRLINSLRDIQSFVNCRNQTGVFFNSETIEKAIENNQLTVEVAAKVFTSVPLNQTALLTIVRKKRLDLLKLLRKNWPFLEPLSKEKVNDYQTYDFLYEALITDVEIFKFCKDHFQFVDEYITHVSARYSCIKKFKDVKCFEFARSLYPKYINVSHCNFSLDQWIHLGTLFDFSELKENTIFYDKDVFFNLTHLKALPEGRERICAFEKILEDLACFCCIYENVEKSWHFRLFCRCTLDNLMDCVLFLLDDRQLGNTLGQYDIWALCQDQDFLKHWLNLPKKLRNRFSDHFVIKMITDVEYYIQFSHLVDLNNIVVLINKPSEICAHFLQMLDSQPDVNKIVDEWHIHHEFRQIFRRFFIRITPNDLKKYSFFGVKSLRTIAFCYLMKTVSDNFNFETLVELIANGKMGNAEHNCIHVWLMNVIHKKHEFYLALNFKNLELLEYALSLIPGDDLTMYSIELHSGHNHNKQTMFKAYKMVSARFTNQMHFTTSYDIVYFIEYESQNVDTGTYNLSLIFHALLSCNRFDLLKFLPETFWWNCSLFEKSLHNFSLIVLSKIVRFIHRKVKSMGRARFFETVIFPLLLPSNEINFTKFVNSDQLSSQLLTVEGTINFFGWWPSELERIVQSSFMFDVKDAIAGKVEKVDTDEILGKLAKYNRLYERQLDTNFLEFVIETIFRDSEISDDTSELTNLAQLVKEYIFFIVFHKIYKDS